MLEALGSFLSCSNKKRTNSYQDGQSLRSAQTANTAARQYEEMEPMIYQQRAQALQESSKFRCIPAAGPQKVFCECCCGCLCAATVAVLALLAYIVGTSSIEVYGTSFTFWNYYIPQFKYLLAGEADTQSLSEWYRELANESKPLVGVGPGPNTLMYYGWQEVKDLLEDFALRIRMGTMKRYNELGVQIVETPMWTFPPQPILGLTNSDHAAIRPYLGATLDGAEGAWDKNCDGSKCWNAAWLRREFKERFARLDEIKKDDLWWIISVVLHKVHLNLNINDEEAKDFAAFQEKFIKVVPFKRNWFWETFLGSFPVEVKNDYLETYEVAIRRKWPEELWKDSPIKLKVLASSMLDSLALLGGDDLPSVLDFMISLMFMDSDPGKSIRPLQLNDEPQLHNFIWETLRRYPPVAGVPRWITDDGGKSWQHQILNVAQALHDPSVFPDPLAYRLGRPGLNHEDSTLSIGWADFAMLNSDVSDPNSHSCPGKQLSFRILTCFIQEFEAAGPWKVENPEITLTSYGSSGWTLRKDKPK